MYIITLLIREGQEDSEDCILEVVGRGKGRNTERDASVVHRLAPV